MLQSQCPICDTTIEQRATGARRVFCSMACKQKAIRLRAAGKAVVVAPLICPECGKAIEGRKLNARYCSTPCRWKAQGKEQQVRREKKRQLPQPPRPKLSSAERHHQTLTPDSLLGVLADLPEQPDETPRQRERRERHNRVNAYLRSLQMYGCVPVQLLPHQDDAGQPQADGAAAREERSDVSKSDILYTVGPYAG